MGQRDSRIQKRRGIGHDLGPAHGIVGTVPGRAIGFRDGVGPVECVVEAAPPGIGGVYGIAGIRDGDHQLRTGHARDFRVHARGFNRKIRAFRKQVPDTGQKAGIGPGIMRYVRAVGVPDGDGGLHGLAPGEQQSVFRAEGGGQPAQGGEKILGGNAGCRQDLLGKDGMEGLFHG